MKLETLELKYKSTRHGVFACEYHVIWCTKYRRSVLSNEIQERLKSLILEAQTQYGYNIRAIETMPDHVHILVSIPPSESVANMISRIKGYTSKILREEFPELKTRLPNLWTRSRFVASTGGVTLRVLKQYVENQKGV
jgi:putative transposase